MKYYKIFIHVILLISIISCTKEKDVITNNCIYENTLYKWSDSSFISSFIGEIVLLKDKLFINDAMNGRYVVLDSNMKLVKTIGTPGSGPGEFVAPGNISMYKDSLYIYDFRKNAFSVFTEDGLYMRSFMNKQVVQSYGMRRQTDGAYIISTPFLPNPITCYNLNGNNIGGFGKFYTKYAPSKGNLMNVYNMRDLQPFGDKNIVAVMRSQPVIELYDANGNLILLKDIMNIKEIKELYEDKNINTMKGAMFLFRSAITNNNKLFILSTHSYTPESYINLILEFEYIGGDLIYKSKYILEPEKGKPASYSCFNFLNNKIVAYNWASKSIDIYKILE